MTRRESFQTFGLLALLLKGRSLGKGVGGLGYAKNAGRTMELDKTLAGVIATAEAVQSGRVSAEALALERIGRVERREALIRAFAFFDRRLVLEAAREIDRRMSLGEPMGPLAGVPLGIKDIILTKGIPTGMGSPIFEGFVPDVSAKVIDRIEDAQGYVFAKTVTTEFAWMWPGKTKNPWNPEHTPGGSSMGSAAAVAAGFVPGAIGTQTIGSTIRPAAFCGVVGYKPSMGLISRTGIHPLSPTLDHVGVFATSVPDAAYLASCLVGFDSQDPKSLSTGALGYSQFLSMSRPPRLAIVRTPFWARSSDPQKDLFERNLLSLQNSGASLQEIELPQDFARAEEVLNAILAPEAAHIYDPLQKKHSGTLSGPLRALIEKGKKTPALDYLQALKARMDLLERLKGAFDGFEAILTIPAPGEAPKSLKMTGDPIFCLIWTLLGLPAVSIPSGFGPNGLPMGLQIVGKPLMDRKTLEAAAWCESALADGKV